MAKWTAQMRKADEVLQKELGVGLKGWFLLEENVELSADPLAEKLTKILGRPVSSATFYNWWPRMELERRTRLVDLEAEPQQA